MGRKMLNLIKIILNDPPQTLEGFDLSKAGCLCDESLEGSSFVGTTSQWMGKGIGPRTL